MNYSLSERLRQAIRASGRSTWWFQQRAGVHNAAIGRFLRGERTLSLGSVDKIAAALGLELRTTKKGGRS